ncbi:MAG: hypothetical protein ACRCX7_11085 [Cetobacterium sp.]|uniref:hypothetical protein n=1 Tax=Cetobacterium sp. TaxID=2071632 RepID=UPI003F35F310
MVKIEKSAITIKGKEYSFLKPTAVELIEIEDKCFKPDGTMDTALYNELMIGLISKTIKIGDLVEFNSQEVELSTGDKLTLPEVGYAKWLSNLEEMGGFSRIKLAKTAVASTGVSGEINLSGFKYQDIDALAMAYFTLYDTSELKRVVDEVATFCFS